MSLYNISTVAVFLWYLSPYWDLSRRESGSNALRKKTITVLMSAATVAMKYTPKASWGRISKRERFLSAATSPYVVQRENKLTKL